MIKIIEVKSYYNPLYPSKFTVPRGSDLSAPAVPSALIRDTTPLAVVSVALSLVHTKAVIPAICGVAMDVPDQVPRQSVVPPLHVVVEVMGEDIHARAKVGETSPEVVSI